MSQGVWSAGIRAAGPVLQARRAGGHEAAHLRAEELEQLYLPEAGCGRQAPRLHRTHLQPDAPHGHVDGHASHGKEPGHQGAVQILALTIQIGFHKSLGIVALVNLAGRCVMEEVGAAVGSQHDQSCTDYYDIHTHLQSQI